jgi:hypothetical protein
MTLKTPIDSISRKDLLKLNNALKVACSEIIGKSGATLKTLKSSHNYYQGFYDIPFNQIVIYRGSLDTIEQYVKVFIHEWTHSCQKKILTDYCVMDAKYGYRKNPFEIEARASEKKHKSDVWKMTKDLLRK